MLTSPARYRIRVQGHLGAQWADWFGGFTLSWEVPGETVLVGQIIDQAALGSAPVGSPAPGARDRFRGGRLSRSTKVTL